MPTDVSGVKRTAPTAVAGAGAGTSPPAPVVASPDSSDDRGSLTFGSGTGPGAGVVVTVNFAAPKDPSRLPVVMIQEATAASAGIDLAVTSITAAGFSVSTNTRNLTASQPATTYGFNWICLD